MAKAGYGTTLTGATSGLLGGIKSLSHSGFKRAVIDVTNTTSPGRYRVKIPGVIDCGTYTVQCIQNLASGDGSKHKTYFDKVSTQVTPEVFTVAMGDAQTILGSGYIKGSVPFTVGSENEAVGTTFTIKLTSTGSVRPTTT
jgi:predicted secreted protein